MKKHEIIKMLLLAVLILPACINAFAATPTADDIMKRASANLKSAKGVNCKFSLTADKRTINGTLKTSGNKFAITTPLSSAWYNGKCMWTYNPSSKETTLVVPTSAELRETNPLEYIKEYYSSFTPALSNKKQSGKYIVTLTPKKKSSEVRSLELTLNSSSLKPDIISVTLKNGTVTKITINSIEYNAAFKAIEFDYPKSKYPKIPIIDLR